MKHMRIIMPILLILALCGCGTGVVTESAAATQAQTATAPAQTAQLQMPTSDPLIELEFSLTDEEKAVIPEIEGLYRTKVGEEYTYLAFEGNEYGLEEGAYAGVYRDEVYYQIFSLDSQDYLLVNPGEVEKSGGVCLVASVAEKIVLAMEESYPKTHGFAPIPVDISGINTKEKITVSYDPDVLGLSTRDSDLIGGMRISLPESAPIVNICHSVDSFSLIDPNGEGDSYIVSDTIIHNIDWQRELNTADGVAILSRYSEAIYFVSDLTNNSGELQTFDACGYGDIIVEAGPEICVGSMTDSGDGFMFDLVLQLESESGLVPLFVQANNAY